ncbi:MAG: hypothetical protein DRP51_04565 [Candidatus Zixiibacteriota bacterium]|nr:MAG: hypothetical protein DRP51_04565 [candidate division Zixibacteria bacterium]
MKRRKTKSGVSLHWIIYSFLVGLVLIRIIPFLDPTGRYWGLSHLIYLPDYFAVLFFIISAVALSLPFFQKAASRGDSLAQRFSALFLDGRRAYINRIIFVAVIALIFIVNVAPTHFLGDSYILIKDLTPATGMFFKWGEIGIFKWSEIGVAKFMIIVKSLLGGSDKEGALLAFRIVSIVSGLITVWFFFLISRIATENKIKRLIIFTSSIFSGSLLLFFGYAEHYHIIWAFHAALIYFCLKYYKLGRGIVAAWIILFIGIVFHMQMFIFMPAVVFATLSKGRGFIFYQGHKKLIYVTFAIAALSVIAAVLYKYLTDLYIEDMFLPLFTGKPGDPLYAVFSPPHLADILNEFLLIAPIFFLVFILGLRNIRTIFKQGKAAFLALSSAGCMLLIFLVDPKLGMPRDWDLFSLTPFSITLLFILLLDDSAIVTLKKFLIPIVILLSISPVPYLLTTLNRDASIEYVEQLIKLDSHKTIAGLIILYDYYKELGDNEKTRILGYQYHTNYPTEIKCNRAMDAMDEDNLELAALILSSVKPNKFDASYQRALSRLYSLQGDYERALKHIDWTIELRRYFSQVYRERAMIYLNLNQHDKVFRDLRKAYQLDDSSIVILEGLTYVHTYYKQYDSCIHYAERMKHIDSSSPVAYYWLANAYAQKQNYDSAKYYVNECTVRIGEDSILAVGLNNLRKQIDNLQSGNDGK